MDDAGNFTRTGTVVDLGVNDGPWSVDVDYGDGSPVEPLETYTGAFSLSHDYDANGLFMVSVTATDTDGGSSTTAATVGVYQGAGPDPSLTPPLFDTIMWEDLAEFEALAQDIWGPVTGGTGEARWQLFYETWSGSGEVGKIHWNVVFGWDFGATVGASTSGHVGMYGKASDLKGKVDVLYPGTLSITAPDLNTFLAGERLSLPSGWELTAGALIDAGETTSSDLSLHGQLEVDARVWAKLCVFNCWSPTLLNINSPAYDFRIIGIDDVDGLWLPQNIGELNLNPFSVTPDETTTNPTTGVITASGENLFSEIELDLDGIASVLTPLPPMEIKLNLPDHFSGRANLFDVDANVDLSAIQNLSFQGTPIIELAFDPPVAGVTGDFLSVADDFSEVVYRAGASVDVIFPSAQETPTTVTPTVWLENTFTNDTELRTDSELEMEALSLFLDMDSYEVWGGSSAVTARVCVEWDWWYPWACHKRKTVTIIPAIPAVSTPSVNLDLGPLWGPEQFAELSVTETLANGTFSLGGFQSITLDSFLLDPEVPPVADAGGPYTVDEGSTVTLDASASHDADGDTLSYEWDFDDDGVFDDASGSNPLFDLTADDAFFAVAVRVWDDYNHNTANTTVTVDNVAPILDLQAPQTVDEGVSVSRLVTFTDPGADTWNVAVDWGDGTVPDGALGLSLRELAVGHVYADNGIYTVTIDVVDDDGGTDAASFTVTVNNVAPTPDAGDDQAVNEGDLVSLDPATFNDLGTLDTHTATIDWGDTTSSAGAVTELPFGPPGSTSGADGTVDGSHVYADNGAYTVTVCVEDDEDAMTCDTLTMTVLNVAPTVNAGPDVEVVIHDTVPLDPATFNDLGTLDSHTAVIDWGYEAPVDAGVVTETLFGPPGSTTGADGTVDADHIYRLPGTYIVTVTVIDDDGVGTATSTVKVLGARDLKERAIGLIDDYVGDSTFIEKAIDNINSSLEDRRWLDAVHLDPDHGHRVYSEEKQAYVQLANAIGLTPGNGNPKKGGSPLSGAAVDAVHDAIDLLVNADRVIAITQLLDAQALPPAEPKVQKKVSDHVDRAEAELAQGDAARAAGDFIEAIDSYRSAWHHASLALDLAAGPQTYRWR